MVSYPKKIMIVVDENILEFKEVKTLNKVVTVIYVYSKSISKLGMSIPITLSQLDGMIKNNIAKIL